MPEPKNGIRKLLPWMPLVATLVLIGIAWGANETQVKNIQDDIDDLDKQVVQINAMKVEVAVIKEKVGNIEKRQEDNSDMLKEILRKVR